MSAQPWPDKLYALRGGPVPGFLEAALFPNYEACERNGIEIATYVPADQHPVLSQEQRGRLRDIAEALELEGWSTEPGSDVAALRDLAAGGEGR